MCVYELQSRKYVWHGLTGWISSQNLTPKGGECIFLQCKIFWKACRASTEMAEVAERKIQSCSGWNVNKFFIPVPKVLVHTMLKELLITFATCRRMTNENFRLCGSLPFFWGIHPSCIPTNCYPATQSAVELSLLHESSSFIRICGVFRPFRVCSGWKANRAYGKFLYLLMPSKSAVGYLAHRGHVVPDILKWDCIVVHKLNMGYSFPLVCWH